MFHWSEKNFYIIIFDKEATIGKIIFFLQIEFINKS